MIDFIAGEDNEERLLYSPELADSDYTRMSHDAGRVMDVHM